MKNGVYNMKMIIGLGNPGKEYAQTKHNVGFMVVDAIADELNVSVEKRQCQAFTQMATWDGEKFLLVKPQTYMNLSGQSVMELLNYYKDKIDDLLVIHDDLDLPPGQLRFKQGGGAGGHNGIKNIIAHLNSNDFDRLKIGIGRGKNETKDYVLTPFAGTDKKLIDEAVATSVDAVKIWLKQGIAPAMNQYNSKAK